MERESPVTVRTPERLVAGFTPARAVPWGHAFHHR